MSFFHQVDNWLPPQVRLMTSGLKLSVRNRYWRRQSVRRQCEVELQSTRYLLVWLPIPLTRRIKFCGASLEFSSWVDETRNQSLAPDLFVPYTKIHWIAGNKHPITEIEYQSIYESILFRVWNLSIHITGIQYTCPDRYVVQQSYKLKAMNYVNSSFEFHAKNKQWFLLAL